MGVLPMRRFWIWALGWGVSFFLDGGGEEERGKGNEKEGGRVPFFDCVFLIPIT